VKRIKAGLETFIFQNRKTKNSLALNYALFQPVTLNFQNIMILTLCRYYPVVSRRVISFVGQALTVAISKAKALGCM